MSSRIIEIVNQLNQGKLVCFPTDTVYALACLPNSKKAIHTIYQLKKREKSKPFAFLVKDLKQAQEYTSFSRIAKKIAEHFWPGALTLVLPDTNNITTRIHPQTHTIGLRSPNHPIAQEILAKLDQPIIATSINLSGSPAIINSENITIPFRKKIDFIIEGSCTLGISSTVIKVENNRYTCMREGSITLSQIKSIVA